MSDVLLLTSLFFVSALLYSSVGHAGASGYLAAMALMGVSSATMKPTALVLNIIVATIATIKFYRAGFFSWSILWPFALTSVPFSYIGGTIVLQEIFYKPAVGLVLIYAAFRVFWSSGNVVESIQNPVRVPIAIFSGSVIGLLSGLTGVGGGIFLTPLLLFLVWADTRRAAGVSAAFILCNSIAGLAGLFTKTTTLPSELPYYLVGVVAGGWIGAEYGSKKLGSTILRKLLSLVLIIAGAKMIFVLFTK